MKSNDDILCQQIVLGWVLEFMLLVAMLLVMVVYAGIADRFSEYIRWDPGAEGLVFVVYELGLFAALPVYTYIIRERASRWWRWPLVVIAAITLIFTALHHLMHALAGQRQGAYSHVLELVAELVLAWLVINTFRWARMPRPAGARERGDEPGPAPGVGITA